MAINYIDDKIFEQLNNDVFEHVLRGDKYTCYSESLDCTSECLTDGCPDDGCDVDCGCEAGHAGDDVCYGECYNQCDDCRCHSQCNDCTCNNNQCNDCSCNGSYTCPGDNHICDGEDDCWCDGECPDCYNYTNCPGYGCSNYCSSDSRCECDCY